MTTDRLHLQLKHRQILEELLQEHLPEVEVWAYGSRITGRSHDGSDLDLVLRGPGLKKISIENLTEFEEALRESSIPFLVEARDWARLPERFHREIEKDYVLLCDKAPNVVPRPTWTTATIGGISEKVAMGPFGSSIKVSTFVPEGIPIISGQHLHGIRVDDSPGFNFISHEHAQRLSNANVQRGDIVFTHAGNIGQVAYIPEQSKFDRYIISQRQFYMRCDRSKALPEFVALYFKSPEGQHQLLANAAQVGVPSIAQPVTYLRTIEISLPPLPEQRAIARILSALDDKIELNRRMNETLESMARTLYKSWFIDFDPVRAKMEGRDTGLPNDITDLFPDRMVNSELGEIPEEWEVKKLSEMIDLNPKRSLQNGKLAPYLDMANMPTNGHVPDVVRERPYGSGMRFMNGDTLVARITPCLENGKTAYVDFLKDGETGWGSTEYIVLKPIPPLPDEFVYYLARSTRFREFAIQNMIGTSGRQRVPAKALSEFLFALPPGHIAIKFGKIARSILSRVSEAAQESNILVTLRDTLLPRLVSGELRLRYGWTTRVGEWRNTART